MKVEAPERIWIESEGGCPYFYHEEELSDVAPPITEYVRADKLEELAAELGHLLTRTAAALKGEPPEGVWHSWHELPEKAAQLAEALRKLEEREQSDEAILQQALEGIELHLRHHERGCVFLDEIALALRERLGEKA